jgi:hypothetical protein
MNERAGLSGIFSGFFNGHGDMFRRSFRAEVKMPRRPFGNTRRRRYQLGRVARRQGAQAHRLWRQSRTRLSARQFYLFSLALFIPDIFGHAAAQHCEGRNQQPVPPHPARRGKPHDGERNEQETDAHENICDGFIQLGRFLVPLNAPPGLVVRLAFGVVSNRASFGQPSGHRLRYERKVSPAASTEVGILYILRATFWAVHFKLQSRLETFKFTRLRRGHPVFKRFGHGSLPNGFVEHYPCGDRNIQRLYVTSNRDTYNRIATLAHQAMQTRALAT